ncbi:MAG: DUF4402 domain-containing protein [Nonlabens sp.]|uniref:DUF4402 domain-containing protein n=1 Tax=Nonlabens sp. TaxID=1888209 RepID=UPI0035A5C56D
MKNKNNVYLVVLVLFAGFFTNSISAQTGQSGDSETGSAYAHVVVAMEMIPWDDLRWGTLISTGEAATLVMDPITSAITGGTGHVASGGSPATSAVWLAHGTKGSSYAISVNGSSNTGMTIPGAEVTLTADFPAGDEMQNTMVMTDFTIGFRNGEIEAIIHPEDSMQYFHLGGSLSMVAGQTEGTYSGSYDVSIDYN